MTYFDLYVLAWCSRVDHSIVFTVEEAAINDWYVWSGWSE